MSQAKPSHLSHLGALLGATLVGAVMTAVAGSIALVALSLALDAALLAYLTPAGAAAATAGLFAAICGLLAFLTPKLIAGSAKPAPITLASTLNPTSLGLSIEVGLAILAGLVEASRRRRKSDPAANR